MQSLITSALLTNNKQEQMEAQTELCSIISRSPEYYLTECSAITLNESQPQLLRQSAGTLLSKAVKSRPNFESSSTYWDTIQLKDKDLIKNNLLSCLTTNNQLAKRSAANGIASIASVEVVRGEWPTLIPNLVRIIGGEDLPFVQTAIMTLGFISQEIVKTGIKLPLSQEEQIFKGVFLGFDAAQKHKNLPLRKASLEVLRDGLNFFVDILQKSECRSYISNAIFQGINSRQTAEVSIQALGEYCKYAYLFMDQIVAEMNQTLLPKIQAGGMLAIAAMQIWNTIGNEYLQRKRRQDRVNNTVLGNNYLLSIHQELSKLIMQSLIKVDDEELVISATNTLGTVVSVCGLVSFPLIVNFVSNTISCSDSNIKQASLLAFAALTESDQTEIVLGYFSNALNSLTGLLKDPSPIVLRSTLQGFARIFQKEVFVSQFISRPYLQLNVNVFLDLVKHRKFAVKQAALKAMGALFQNFKMDMSGSSNNLVSVVLKTLTDSFFGQSESIPYLYITCIINLLINNDSYQLAFNYVNYVVDKMETAQQDGSLVSGGMSIIAVGVRTMSSIYPDTQFMDKVFDFVARYFTKIEGIDPNGLPVLGSLASTYKKLFNKYFRTVWKFMEVGLASIDDNAIYTSALCCLSDVAVGLGSFFVCDFEWLMKILLDGLTSDIRGEVKILLFDTIADLIGVIKMQAQPFVPEILSMIELGLNSAVLSNEDKQYVEQLRTSLIRIETELYYTLNDFGMVNSHTKQHFPQLLQFVMHTCRKEQNPTVEYLKLCVELCYMCASTYECAQLIRTPKFQEYLNQLQHFVSTQQGLDELLRLVRRLLYNPL